MSRLLPRSPRYWSVRARLMVWNVTILALLLALLGGIVQFSVESLLITAVDKDLVDRVQHAPRMPGPPPGGPFGPGRYGPGGPGPYDHPGPYDRAGTRMSGQPGPHPDDRTRSGQHSRPDPHIDYRQGTRPDDRRGPRPDDGGGMGPPPGGPDADWLRRQRESLMRAGDTYSPRMLGLDGKDMFPGRGPWDGSAVKKAAHGQDVKTTIVYDGEPVRILSTPREYRGKIIGVAQIPHPLKETYSAIEGVRDTLLALIPVALLLAALGGAAVTDRALRPVGDIAQATDRIGARDLSRRLPVVGSDEFSQLAGTINRMLGRLESAFAQEQSLVHRLGLLLEQQKRFTADASHELKTPLAVAKVHTGLLLQSAPTPDEYRESVEDIDRAVDTMSRLVQDLLLLAQNDADQPSRGVTELLVRDILEAARRNTALPGRAPLTIEAPDPALMVSGSELEMVRVFSNLFENAARHTPPDGQIRATAHAIGDRVLIQVADTGCGIAREHLAHLGERFYRVDAARARPHGGVGLGLSICKSIVESQQGTITFDSIVGAGTTVSVSLPLVTPPAAEI